MIEAGALPTEAVDARALYRRITRRLIPYLFLLYIVAYLDRVNVGFAAMDMKRQLHFSDTVYGTGAGMFFLGYALFDLPSSLMLRVVGTRLWIARIMITWGIIAACMMFVGSPLSFYVMRFLLGVAEAGFVPGMLLYLTFWFPSHERARAVAKFMTATSLAGAVGGPLSSALLKLDGLGGLAGWQWLFVAEGIPTVLIGISVLFILNDGPDKAKWLAPSEKLWLKDELEQDRKRYGAAEHHSLIDAFKLPAVWLLAGVYIVIQIGVYVVNLWMPLMLGSFASGGSGDASLIARYSTVPYLLAAVFTVLVGWSSDRWNERQGHLAACMALAAAGFCWAALAHSVVVALFAFCLAAMGLWSTMGPFWALTTRKLEGAAAAGGVAMITMIGGFGGFLGPYLTGRLKDATHSYAGGLYGVAALALAAAILAISMRTEQLRS
ncbi:MFS transporter [Granulicella sp. dw_53]|uniref:MFS transporter n=1 Tax=Granulicella sp. dw_53 TaxID=2719792 RepID=UPI001BD4F2AF|nr:MFS transporter [Granulicella sp. dw_53]